MLAAMLSVLIMSAGGGGAKADTTSTPDTNTRAVLDPNPTPPQTCNPTPPTQATTPCATASNGMTPGDSSTLSNAVGGSKLSIHIDASAGTFFNVTRTALCRGSLTGANDVSLSSQILPSSGDCVPGGGMPGGEAGNGNHSAGASNPPNTYVDYTFSVGSGTYTPPGG
ncbi:MAG TPA: hypothetical protein VNY84_01120, partial [Acidimicrobiales bacterium]|nr:hypothetical protein [Acidimicrobiales bacterium]